MDDLVSRKAAIDAIGKVADELYENIKKGATFPQRQWFDGMAHAQSILEDLPSAQPERKKGHWIKQELAPQTLLFCSLCGCKKPQGVVGNFCPNCGADMRGEEHDE